MKRTVHAAQHREGRHFFLFDPDRIAQIETSHFDHDWWARQDKLLGHARGRGSAAFVDAGEQGWVLRHYLRGGLVARLIKDHYLWLGLERTRAFREWRLLAALREQGLPVPQPVAAQVQRSGVSYTADLITARIPDAKTLAQYLCRQRLAAPQWQKLGALIARFHRTGAYHHDMNAHNIMLDAAGAFWLIDFDKGRLRAPGAWQKASCERLKRSLQKLDAAQAQFYFTPSDWQTLMGGYLAVSSGAA